MKKGSRKILYFLKNSFLFSNGNRRAFFTCFWLLLFCINVFPQKTQRPFIWVDQNDKAKILNKIETQDWAKSFYGKFKKRVDDDIILYKSSPSSFFKVLPFNWSNQEKGKIPPFKIFTEFTEKNSLERYTLNKYLQIGIDCGVLYYLTEDEVYAQCALDILHTYIKSMHIIQILWLFFMFSI